LTYWDKDAAGNTVLYIYDAVANASTLVNNPAASGLDLTHPWCSSTEFRLFGPAIYKGKTRGIVSFDPATRQFSWVIQEGGAGPNKISSFSPVVISPDGTALAFGLLRNVSSGRTLQTVPSLVRVPVNGGGYTPLVTFTDSITNGVNPVSAGPGWKW
jgi:hypothetical protein